MIVITGYDAPHQYQIAVARSRYALTLPRAEKERLLEELAARYSEALAAALDNMVLPEPTVQPGYDNEALIVPVGSSA
jgi:hypothetical protein